MSEQKPMGVEVFGPAPRSRPASAPANAHSGEYAADQPQGRGARGPGLGILALLLAVGFAVVHVVAVIAGVDGDFARSSQLAYVAIGGTAVSLLLGAVTVVIGAGRRWGVVAVLVSLVANPLVLIRILDFFGGLGGASA